MESEAVHLWGRNYSYRTGAHFSARKTTKQQQSEEISDKHKTYQTGSKIYGWVRRSA